MPTNGCFFGGRKETEDWRDGKISTRVNQSKTSSKNAEWATEETEHWFCGSSRNEGDLNEYLETLDIVVSDLKEHIAYDDKPSLLRAEASIVLDELPHLIATLSEYDYQVIARMVAQAKVKSLQDTRTIILGGNADWLSTTSPAPVTPFVDDSLNTPTLSELLQSRFYNQAVSEIEIANAFVVQSLQHNKSLIHMQAQKLTYIAHGYYLALTGRPLLNELVSAWKYGSVISGMYDAFKNYGNRPISSTAMTPYGIVQLDPQAESVIGAVYKFLWRQRWY